MADRLDRNEDPSKEPDGTDTWSDVVMREEGAIGYIAAWLLGVPAGLLFVIFLLRGCN